jgi:hypothetical protein
MVRELIIGEDVWPAISALLRQDRKRPARVAMAFVTSHGKDLLPLRAGDRLLVNGSPEAVAAHATDPRVLSKFIELGIQVRSHDRLHAKFVVVGTRVVVGSANASRSSASNLIEATLSAGSTELAATARNEFDRMFDSATQLDPGLLADLEAIWEAAGKYRQPVPGVTADAPWTGLVPPRPWVLHHWSTKWGTDTEASDKAFRSARRLEQRTPAHFRLTSVRAKPAAFRGVKENHFLLQTYEERGIQLVWPPGRIRRADILVQARTYSRMALYCERTDLDPLPLAEVNEALRRAGCEALVLDRARTITDQDLISQILGMWNLV